MLAAALDEKLCLERHKLKMLGAALDKNMLGAVLGKKLCLVGRQLKNGGCCVREEHASSSFR